MKENLMFSLLETLIIQTISTEITKQLKNEINQLKNDLGQETDVTTRLRT